MKPVSEMLIMGGYGWYVWPAYVSVLGYLLTQWFLSWRRWKKSLHE